MHNRISWASNLDLEQSHLAVCTSHTLHCRIFHKTCYLMNLLSQLLFSNDYKKRKPKQPKRKDVSGLFFLLCNSCHLLPITPLLLYKSLPTCFIGTKKKKKTLRLINFVLKFSKLSILPLLNIHTLTIYFLSPIFHGG